MALLLAALALGIHRVHRSYDRHSILLAATWTTYSFFVLPTEMTERYLLVSIPLLILLAPYRREWFLLAGVVTVTAFANLYLVFPLVRIAPWDALELPHSNFYYYLRPAHGPPLPVLAPWSEEVKRGISIAVAAVHVLVLALLAVRIGRGVPAEKEPGPETIPRPGGLY